MYRRDGFEASFLIVDGARRRLALRLRRLQPEPWSVVHERYAVGQLVDATVTKLTNFGAFARLDDGIEGLIHLSELSEKRVGHARDVLREGQRMRLRIIRIDPQRRRIGLSLKQAPEEEYTEMDWREQLAEMGEDEPASADDSDSPEAVD